MEVKRRTDYALRMMIRLAEYTRGPLSVKKMSEADNVPYQFARAIQRDLNQAGLITVVRGSRGGALLARPASEITFYDVFMATQGYPHCSPCTFDKEWCERQGECQVHPVWVELEGITESFLKTKTIADFVKAHTDSK